MGQHVAVFTGRRQRIVRYPGPALPMAAFIDGGGPGPGPDPYLPTTYWAEGDYGFIRHGDEHVVNQGVGGGQQTLPSYIALPAVPDAHELNLSIDIEEWFGFSNVWTFNEARILIDGDVWMDWFTWSGRMIIAGQPVSWPPPAGTVTIQLRAAYHPPTGTEDYLDYRWNDVDIRRYAITIWYPNPEA
jgi:hypothetical protein